MATTPERPGFLLLWIAAVVLSLSLAVAPLLPGPQAGHRDAAPDAGAIGPPVADEPAHPALDEIPALPEGLDGEETVQAGPAAGTVLMGRVVGPASRPCPGATVRVRRPGQVQILGSVATDDLGRFRLPLGRLLTEDQGSLVFVSAVRGKERSDELPWHPAGTAREILLVLRPTTVAEVPPRAETRAVDRHGLWPGLPELGPELAGFWLPYGLRPVPAGAGGTEDENREGRLRRVDLLLQPLAGRQLLLLRMLAWLREQAPAEEALEQALAELPEDLAGKIRQRLRDRGNQGGGGDGHEEGRSGGRDRWQKTRAAWKQHADGHVEILVELSPAEAARLLDQAARRNGSRASRP